MSKPRIAEVVWDDHAFHSGDYSRDQGTVVQRSVGYVVKITKRTIRLAQSYQKDGKKFGEVITIDKRMMRSYRRLK
jgi:hypothetical protein